jgi:hypothetical protein
MNSTAQNAVGLPGDWVRGGIQPLLKELRDTRIKPTCMGEQAPVLPSICEAGYEYTEQSTCY